jgi:hypothetical protein
LEITDPKRAYYTVTIYDVLGRVLREYPKQNSSALTIERADLSLGVYFIKVQSAFWQFNGKMTIE